MNLESRPPGWAATDPYPLSCRAGRQMGKVTGVLSFATWTSTAFVQGLVGRWIDRTGSYSAVTGLAGLVPALGLPASLLFWNQRCWSQFDS